MTTNRSVVAAYAVTAALFLCVSIASPGFASVAHIRDVLTLASFIAIVGIGQTFVILAGGFDLSVPWTLNAAAVLLTVMSGGDDSRLVWVIPVLIALGVCVGLINGFGVAYLGITPIIMTLGTFGMLEGALLVVTNGGLSSVTPPAIVWLSTTAVGPLSCTVVITAILGALAMIVLSRTVFGREVYAVGVNHQVSLVSGIGVRRVILYTYVISGVTAALAGVLLAGYVGTAYLGLGDPYLFASIAAVAIGGTSVAGGRGGYAGTIAGALLLTVIIALLPILNLEPAFLQIIYGAVILIAVVVTSAQIRRPEL